MVVPSRPNGTAWDGGSGGRREKMPPVNVTGCKQEREGDLGDGA